MNNYYRCANKKNVNKTSPPNTDPQFFITAFQKRLGRTPNEYINEKLKTGSHFEDVRYLFNVVSAEISNQNNCKFFDFDYFYKSNPTSQPKAYNFQKTKRPENAGKAWTVKEEQLLIKMYNSGVSKKEMCNAFKRTEVALAARLVLLGIIESRDIFINRKH